MAWCMRCGTRMSSEHSWCKTCHPIAVAEAHDPRLRESDRSRAPHVIPGQPFAGVYNVGDQRVASLSHVEVYGEGNAWDNVVRLLEEIGY